MPEITLRDTLDEQLQSRIADGLDRIAGETPQPAEWADLAATMSADVVDDVAGDMAGGLAVDLDEVAAQIAAEIVRRVPLR